MNTPDIAVTNQYDGLCFELTPLNPKAKRWLREHEPKDSGWLDSGRLRVFKRYAGWFLNEIRGDGFTIFHGRPEDAPRREISEEQKAVLLERLEKARVAKAAR